MIRPGIILFVIFCAAWLAASLTGHFLRKTMNNLLPLLFLLFIFGAVNLLLGLVWNFGRQRATGMYSPKYKAIWIIGVIEMLASISSVYLSS